MKMDPNDCCINFEETWIWAIIHDLIAHPFLAITNYSDVSVKFHNFTSQRAWNRKKEIKNA